MSQRLPAALVLVGMLVAGCSSSSSDDPTVLTKQALAANKGGILGLLIDDIYRPVKASTVYLMPLGLTTTSDASGQFEFRNLDPGTYELKVDSDGHEAAPQSVDVVANAYTELELEARRIASTEAYIITRQYSVFIPCAFDYVVNGYIVGCVPDTSGDSWRPGFTSDTREYGANITYLVTEAKMNQVGDYDLQVREETSSSSGGARYAVGRIIDDDYLRMTIQYGVANTEHNEQNNNQPWNNTAKYATLVFMSGEQRDTFSDVSENTCTPEVDDLNRAVGSPVRTCSWRGIGAQFAIKATFVQSLFLGEPLEPVSEYNVLE